MSIDVMKQALEAVEDVLQWSAEYSEVRAALRAAIERAREPVAYMNQNGVIHEADYEWGPSNDLTPLYTAPRQWQGLTEIEFRMLYVNTPDYKTLWEAIEAALRERNT